MLTAIRLMDIYKPILFYLKQPSQLELVHLDNGTFEYTIRRYCGLFANNFIFLVSSQDGIPGLRKPVEYSRDARSDLYWRLPKAEEFESVHQRKWNVQCRVEKLSWSLHRSFISKS